MNNNPNNTPENPTVNNVDCANLPLFLEVWKKTVDVQQHFNDLELRIRNFAITVLGAVLSAAILTLKDDIRFSIFGKSAPIAAILVLIAFITWFAFYFMDRFWYHRLLLGAVKHGKTVEDHLKGQIPIICLAGTIGNESPTFRGKIHSSNKIDIFYGIIGFFLFVFFICLFFRQASPIEATTTAIQIGDGKPEVRFEKLNINLMGEK
jgi:hypothetical protein